MEEIWKPVLGYEQFYLVSNYGRVKSNCRNTTSGIIRKLKINNCGYLVVNLCKNGIISTKLVHRLVYEAFCGKIPEGLQINHINEVRTDNRIENLEIVTPKENSNWGTHNKKLREKSTGRKINEDSVKIMAEKHKKAIAAYKDGVLVMKFDSAADASKINKDYNCVSISAACNGRLKTYKGYIWKFLEDERDK